MSRRRLAFAAVLSTSIAGLVPVLMSPAQADAPAPAGSGTVGKTVAPLVPPADRQGPTIQSTGTHTVSSGVTPQRAASAARAAAAAQPAPADATVGTLPTELYVKGAPNESVSGGQTFHVTDAAQFTEWNNTNLARFTAWDGTGEWDLDFNAVQGQSLVVGTYPDARRGIPAFPGIDVSGHSYGCAQTFGAFTVLELATDPATGVITRFNATFEQRCELADRPLMVGVMRYHATLPTPVPSLLEPAVAASEVTAGGGATVVADASATTSDRKITNYHFAWDDGSSTDSATPVMSHPFAAAGPHSVTVTVTDESGTSRSKQASVVPDTLTASVTPKGLLSVTVAAAGTSSAGVRSYDIDWGDQSPHGSVLGAAHTYPRAGTFPVVVTMTDGAGQSVATDPMVVTTTGSDYTAVGPVRIMDTRDGTGLGGATPKLTAADPIHLKVAGVNGVPADATAVAVNVTVADNASGGGAVGVTPDDAQLTTSNLNYAPGQIVPNMVIVPIGADGSIEFQKLGAGQTDVIADLFGYYSRTQGQGFNSTSPFRVLDTRTKTGWSGGKVATGRPVRVKVTGVGGVPASGVTAVAVNLTVTETAGFGNLAAGPAGFTTGKSSWTSNLNYGNAQTVANMAIVPVDAGGYVDLVNAGPGSASVIMDVNGYYSGTAKSAYLPVDPSREIDTRAPGDSQIGPQWIRSYGFAIDRNGNVDPTLTALVTNTTVANTKGGGFLTVFPDNSPVLNPGSSPTPPNASNLNWAPGQIVPNLVFARPGTDGYVSYYNGTPAAYGARGAVDLIVDVFGFYGSF